MATPECLITDNGIRTVMSQDSNLRHQSLVVCVDTSQNPDRDLNYPHFLEHVLMRGRSQFDGESLSQLVDSSANKSNAATYPSLITFGVDCVPSAALHLIPALLETLTKPKFDYQTIETERQIIASEMAKRASSPDNGVWDRAWENHGFVHTAVREAATLGDVTADHLDSFHKRVFTAANMFVVTAGPVPVADIVSMIQDSDIIPGEPLASGIGVRDWHDYSQPVVVGGETKMTGHYLRVFDTIQPGPVAQVFQALNKRECEGSFFSTAVNDIGVYSASISQVVFPFSNDARHYVGTKGAEAKVRQIHDLGTQTIHGFADTPPTIRDLEQVKQVIRNENIFGGSNPPFGNNRPGEVVSDMIRQLPSFPNIFSTEQTLDQVDQVTPDQVQQLAADLLEAPQSYSLVGSKRFNDTVTAHVL